MIDIIKQFEDLIGANYEVIIQIGKKYDEYKARAKRENIDFHLSFIDFDFIVKQNCYICNISGKENKLGIDRLNNNKGYVHNNVAPCCFNCNRAKNDMDITEFRQWITRLNPSHKLALKEQSK